MSYTTKYYVNEEKRTVVCTIESSDWDAVDFFEKSYNQTIVSNSVLKKAAMPRRFVGIAKCAPEDTFDEHIGRVIAFDRAKYKYDHAFIKAVDELCISQRRAIEDCEQRIDKYVNKAANHHFKREDEIEDYMNK